MRSALTAFTWTALAFGVVAVAWRTGTQQGGATWAFTGIAILIAAATTVASNYSLWVSIDRLRQAYGSNGPWPIRLAVAGLGKLGLYIFGGTAIIVLILPIVRNVIGTI